MFQLLVHATKITNFWSQHLALQYCLVLEDFTHQEYTPWIHHWMLTDALLILHESMQTYCMVSLLY